MTGWLRSPLFWLFAVAVVFRGAIGVIQLDRFQADPDAYRRIAETLGRTGVFGLTTPDGEVVPTAFRPPLYPLVLSWLVIDGRVSNLAVMILHALLAGVTAVCTLLAAERWLGAGVSRIAGILAGLLVIVDPILIQQSTQLMTETLATAITGVVIWWWVCHTSGRLTAASAVVLGGWLALAYLCRPTFVVWGAMLVVSLGCSNRPLGMDRWRRVMASALTGLVILASIAAWTARNQVVLGHPIWATTHGGYTLLLANNPLFYRHLRENGPLRRWDPNDFLIAYEHRYEADASLEAYWFRDWDVPVRSQPELSRTLTEHDDDGVTYRAAKATIDRDRSMFWWSCAARVVMLWTPFPHMTEERSLGKVFIIGAYYCLIYAAVLVGLVRTRSRWRSSTWWAIPTLVLTLTMVHAVYWSNMRMRAPATPGIAIMAAAAFQRKRDQ